ncbi:MAG TPA: hypothetical protein VLB29_06125 [Nocardioidaceae bacterium]|nr:hypothetical protein [Nocardioidaceae bacterium]
MHESLAEEHVREFARSAVRSGLLVRQDLHDEVVLAITTELPDMSDPEATANRWIEEFLDELRIEAASWPTVTDYDRLQAAFSQLEAAGIVVLQGCEDHWAAKAVLDGRRGQRPRGVAWFTPPDVWHAIDEGMLEVNVWHASTANVAPGDALLDEVVAAFAGQGLSAHFDEGRVEVGARWQRRLPGAE